MSASPSSQPSTDGGLRSRSLIRCDRESTILDHLDSPPWATTGEPATDVIWVTANRSAADISGAIGMNSPGQMPASVDVISIGGSTIPVRGGDVSVRTISPSENLGRVSEVILDHGVRHESAGHQIVVVLDDLTDLSHHYAPQPIFRFLHLLTAKGRAHGWKVYVGVDTENLESEVINGLGYLFDEVI